ncbi:MAG: ABC transporter permease [Bdellovibrionales bacterium]|nr:ABC transporter permease [Bdellovibrionales bacterium]
METGVVLGALFAGLSVGLGLTALAGENPLHVLAVMGRSAFGSGYDFGLTLFYATPLLLCGLSVALAFHAGLFNIGAEGQLTMGALAAAWVGSVCTGVPAVAAPILAALAAAVAGGFWGWIPGWLKVRRGSHEVINTIMLNFVAFGLANWLVTGPLRSATSHNPETADVAPQYLMRGHFGEAPVSWALPMALALAVALWFLLFRTTWGFSIRAAGQNEEAARFGGLPVGLARILAMAGAGALAGLVGVGEVLGNAGRFRLGFSAEFGFMGIAVALLARNHPLLVIPSSLLFAALHKGAADLDIETENVTRDLSVILQAVVILFVAAAGWVVDVRRRR